MRVSHSLIDYGPTLVANGDGPTLANPDHTVTPPTCPWVQHACIDSSHYASLHNWLHAHHVSLPSTTPVPLAIPPVAPFDIGLDDTTMLDLPDTFLPPQHRDIPVTIVGMTSHPGPSADSPRHTPCSMADSGAKLCITNNPSILTNIMDIAPIPLGVVVTSTNLSTTVCAQQGFLPIPLCDGTLHHQPFLINPHAMETILSPTHVMRSCDRIHAWCQAGTKDSSTTNTLTFMDSTNTPLLILPL